MRLGIPTLSCFLISASAIGVVTPASGATISWASWASSTGTSPGTVTGAISLGAQTVNVTYTGEIAFTQLNNTGTDYYSPSSTFTSASGAGPSTSDMIAISGTTAAHTFTFSAPVVNPVMAIVSLGQPGLSVSYNFSAPFTILSQGPSTAWGGCSTCLSGNGTSTLVGTEGDGTLEFLGTFSSLSFTVTGGEYWNGFTIGEAGPATSSTPEPASWSLAAVALAALGLIALRKRARN